MQDRESAWARDAASVPLRADEMVGNSTTSLLNTNLCWRALRARRIKEVSDKIWLVSFMQYDLGFFDHETARLESAENPFAAKVLPMSPV